MQHVFLLDRDQLSILDLHAGKIEELNRLNDRLMVIEQKIMEQVSELKAFHQQQKYAPALGSTSLSLDASIFFYLKISDPLYNLENDIEMTTLHEYLAPLDEFEKKFSLRDGVNHNEFHNFINHPLRHQHHCWLFHYLYDHTELGWINILRIGEIELNLRATFCLLTPEV